jgi:hypothetical protein
VVPLADVRVVVAEPGDHLLICCDGIYERLDWRQGENSSPAFSELHFLVATFCYAHLRRDGCKNDPALLCAKLLDYSLKRGSTDNMSAVLMQLDPFEAKPPPLPPRRKTPANSAEKPAEPAAADDGKDSKEGKPPSGGKQLGAVRRSFSQLGGKLARGLSFSNNSKDANAPSKGDKAAEAAADPAWVHDPVAYDFKDEYLSDPKHEKRGKGGRYSQVVAQDQNKAIQRVQTAHAQHQERRRSHTEIVHQRRSSRLVQRRSIMRSKGVTLVNGVKRTTTVQQKKKVTVQRGENTTTVTTEEETTAVTSSSPANGSAVQ